MIVRILGEGQYEVKLGGSFEPGKLFSVTALVSDPSPGQALTLELPEGVEAVEGRAVQPVPPPGPDQANSVVMWKGRVMRPAECSTFHGLNQGRTPFSKSLTI